MHRQSHNFRLTLGLALAITPLLNAQTTIKVNIGKLQGLTADEVTSFKGVPFAAPPVL
jgi:hypothetical protein